TSSGRSPLLPPPSEKGISLSPAPSLIAAHCHRQQSHETRDTARHRPAPPPPRGKDPPGGPRLLPPPSDHRGGAPPPAPGGRAKAPRDHGARGGCPSRPHGAGHGALDPAWRKAAASPRAGHDPAEGRQL